MFVKHYAPNICFPLNMANLNSAIIPQNILDFVQTFNR